MKKSTMLTATTMALGLFAVPAAIYAEETKDPVVTELKTEENTQSPEVIEEANQIKNEIIDEAQKLEDQAWENYDQVYDETQNDINEAYDRENKVLNDIDNLLTEIEETEDSITETKDIIDQTDVDCKNTASAVTDGYYELWDAGQANLNARNEWFDTHSSEESSKIEELELVQGSKEGTYYINYNESLADFNALDYATAMYANDYDEEAYNKIIDSLLLKSLNPEPTLKATDDLINALNANWNDKTTKAWIEALNAYKVVVNNLNSLHFTDAIDEMFAQKGRLDQLKTLEVSLEDQESALEEAEKDLEKAREETLRIEEESLKAEEAAFASWEAAVKVREDCENGIFNKVDKENYAAYNELIDKLNDFLKNPTKPTKPGTPDHINPGKPEQPGNLVKPESKPTPSIKTEESVKTYTLKADKTVKVLVNTPSAVADKITGTVNTSENSGLAGLLLSMFTSLGLMGVLLNKKRKLYK